MDPHSDQNMFLLNKLILKCFNSMKIINNSF